MAYLISPIIRFITNNARWYILTKVSSILFYNPRKNPNVGPNWRTRGDTFRFFIQSVENRQKIGGALLVKKNYEKKSQCRKKGYVGTLKTLHPNIRTLKTLYPNFEPWEL